MSVAATFKITFAAITWSILHDILYSPLADLEGSRAGSGPPLGDGPTYAVTDGVGPSPKTRASLKPRPHCRRCFRRLQSPKCHKKTATTVTETIAKLHNLGICCGFVVQILTHSRRQLAIEFSRAD